MGSEEAPGHIPWTWVDLRLQATRSAWLSTTRPDGRPHTVPVWFVWDTPSAWFTSDRRQQKNRNLRQQPEAVLCLGDGDDVVIVEGRTAVVHDADEVDRVDEAYAAKYVDPVSGARATARHPDADLYRLDARRVMSWMYGTVAGRTDWHFSGA